MPSLADSQRRFAGALADPAAPAPGDVARPPGRPGTRRFDVYRNNVAVSLSEALRASFPAVEKLVGAEFFAAAARAYIADNPPNSPIVWLFCAHFGEFLDQFGPCSSVPYLGDVARLEFSRLAAYHAADATPVAITSLSEIAETRIERARFAFHPSARLVRSRFPVVSIWADVTGAAGGNTVDMGRGEDALVVRPQLEVTTRILPDGGADFIARLMDGASLDEAAGNAADGHPGFDLAAHLAGLFDTGAVTAAAAV